MVALSVQHAASLAPVGGNVGILASPAVRLTGLFDRAFAGSGVNVMYAPDDDAVLAVSRRIKADGPVPQARDGLARASRDLRARGAQVQMIACTEFSLIADAVDDTTIRFDTLDILTAAVIAFATTSEPGDKAGP
jgi:aspartate racemase